MPYILLVLGVSFSAWHFISYLIINRNTVFSICCCLYVVGYLGNVVSSNKLTTILIIYVYFLLVFVIRCA